MSDARDDKPDQYSRTVADLRALSIHVALGMENRELVQHAADLIEVLANSRVVSAVTFTPNDEIVMLAEGVITKGCGCDKCKIAAELVRIARVPSAITFIPTPTACYYSCPKCAREVQWEGPDAEIRLYGGRVEHLNCGAVLDILRRSDRRNDP